jgi:hypothetical protein
VKIHEDSWKQVKSFENWLDLWSTNLFKSGFVIHDTKQIQICGLRVDTNLKKSGFMINDSKRIHGYTIPWYDSHNLKNYSCHALECWNWEQNRNIDHWPHFMSWVFVNFRASRQMKLFGKCEIWFLSDWNAIFRKMHNLFYPIRFKMGYILFITKFNGSSPNFNDASPNFEI